MAGFAILYIGETHFLSLLHPWHLGLSGNSEDQARGGKQKSGSHGVPL
jgi:hypothetical protein